MSLKKSVYFVFMIIGFLFPCSGQEPGIIWLEAESFETTGGWVNDPQFVDLMGSPYLLANGVDEPVEDAVTHAHVPTDGTYRLWVRCKDWLPSHSPGTFQVLVNGQASSLTFGKSKDKKWKWVDGGTFSIKKGMIEVRLHDLSGWWGRCDTIVLSSHEGFRPADNVALLERQRIQFYNPYNEVRTVKSYDVVVVGGGLAGSAAAVAAARQGCSVALIQDRPVLGGNASSEIDVPPGGDQTRNPLDPKETGIIEEFYRVPDRGWNHDWSSSMERVVRSQKNLDLYLNTRAINVVMKDEQTIDAVLALDVIRNKRMLFPAKVFIDCTGDGWIGFWAGALFRQGREAKSEFNETLAPEESDTRTMGNTLYVAHFKEGDSTPFQSPVWAHNRWKSPDDFEQAGTHFGLEQTEVTVQQDTDGLANRFTHGSGMYGSQYAYPDKKLEPSETAIRQMPVPPSSYWQYEKGKGYKVKEDGGFNQWYVELGGMQDTIYDAEDIRDELFRINLGLWNYVKNYDPVYKEKNKNRRLTWINYVPGKRESRRLVGDYILTQWDYEYKIIHEDNVAYGGWGVDVHHPNGYWQSGPMYYSAYRGQQVSIPFRCLYSKNISNLMMAGRNISVSHVALGGVRVMRTTSMMGQATGVAAAVCVENNEPPRMAGKKHIRLIQQRLLKMGAYVMGQKNEDPNDLARQATVTASSVKSIPDPKTTFAQSGTPLVHDLNMKRAVMFQPGKKHIDRIALYLRSKNSSDTPLTLTLKKAKAFRNFSSNEVIAKSKATVPQKSARWIEFRLHIDVEPDQYYSIELPPVQGLQWDLFPALQENTCRAYGGPDWVTKDECYTFLVDPDGVQQEPTPRIALLPEHVIDGYNRIVDNHPHSWGPDPSLALPQWITLQFEEEKAFNTVHVSYQNYAFLCPDYSIQVHDGYSWKTVVTVSENRQRRNVHTFPQVKSKSLRLVLSAPSLLNKYDSAQVCEIRIYNE